MSFFVQGREEAASYRRAAGYRSPLVILLTGATGLIGRAVLARLTQRGEAVRCLVRDPRRLGVERVRVQIALGDLADPQSFRHALRGVDTVIHLAASIRDQPSGCIEELNGVATWRLVRAAERAGARHFVFFSAIEATLHAGPRFMRSKALAERAVRESGVPHTIFAPSLVYSPGDPYLRLLERMALAPLMLVPGRGTALYQPIWAEDVADCVVAALDGDERDRRYELAGPDTLPLDTVVRLALTSFGRRRALAHVPMGVTRRALRAAELLLGPAAPATPDEVDLLEVSMVTRRGTADAEALGVQPRPMAAVLGAGQPGSLAISTRLPSGSRT